VALYRHGIPATSLVLALARPALADQSVIKHPGDHPDYVLEAEPHLLLAPFHDFDPGIGFRGTLELVDNGFISSINNTVGFGVGVDWTKKRTWIPIVMQWNFWLSRNWSVFGEPGVVLRIEDGVKVEPGKGPDKLDPFAFYAGGRLHFTEYVTLTMRVGRPTASVGISVLL
jgi:hypothetical protein